MFHVSRWAAVFVNTLGEDAEAGLECLRALVPAVKTIPGALFGHSAAWRLEKILRESSDAIFNGKDNTALEYSIRFITLLVEKNRFRNIDSILQKIEDRCDEQKGILSVTAESASPLDDALIEEFRRQISERTGAAKIKIKTMLAPALLGGYRLRIGGLCVDASLKGQLEKMKTVLEEAVLAAVPGAV